MAAKLNNTLILEVIEVGSQVSRIYSSIMIKLRGNKTTICYFIGVAVNLPAVFRRDLNGCCLKSYLEVHRVHLLECYVGYSVLM